MPVEPASLDSGRLVARRNLSVYPGEVAKLVLMPGHTSSTVLGTSSPTLSASQLATLAEVGGERTANVGDVLYRIGDRRYPFIAIREGEVVIHDAAATRSRVTGRRAFSASLIFCPGRPRSSPLS
jgi:hypothetical protein